MDMYYDRNSNRITRDKWVGLLTADHKRVAFDVLPDGTRVSTVWLGLDHSTGEGRPLIFETMTFSKRTEADMDCQRYSTEAEALAGHAEMVKKWSPA